MKFSNRFMDLYNQAYQYAMDKRTWAKESVKVFHNDYKDIIREKFRTQAAYLSPDHRIAVKRLTSTLLYKLPTWRFGYKNQLDSRIANQINLMLKDLIRHFGLQSKLSTFVRKAVLHGIVAGEIVYEDVTEQLVVGGEEKVIYQGGKISFIFYDFLRNSLLIDPLADPEDIRGTARWVIVKVGDYAPEEFYNLAKVLGFRLTEDDKKLLVTNPMADNPDAPDSDKWKPDAVSLWKVYNADGTVEYWANKTYLLGTRLNNKGIKKMPLIFFVPFPDERSIYGESLWEVVKQFVMFKTGFINLATDNAIKNITSPLITDSPKLAEHMNLEETEPDEIIHIESSPTGLSVRDRIAQLQYLDMTPAIASLYNIVDLDAQKVMGVSNLEMGIQDKQVRVSGVVNAMLMNSLSAKSELVRLFENQVLAPLGKDILTIVYVYWDRLQSLITQEFDRELLGNIGVVEVLNGSTLPEDTIRRVDVLASLVQMAMQDPVDFEVKAIITDYFAELGLNIEAYLSSPQEALLKDLLAMGIPQEKAMKYYQVFMQYIQQELGGANAQAGK